MFQILLYHVFNVLFDYRKVWPNTKIFLCLWHVRSAWQKQSCIKIKDAVVWAEVLKNMGHIIHDITQLDGKFALKFVEELLKLMEKILDVKAF
jgi:hypothetical protein